jgi:hypothetical protein
VSWFSRAALALTLLLLLVVAFVVPSAYWEGGLVDLEVMTFVPQYLDDRSTAQKVFDPHGNDFGTYQARELSYLLDSADAQVLDLLMSADRMILVPASAYLASFLTLMGSMLAIRRFSPRAWLPALLLLLAYMTNYIHVLTMGVFYRSAKPVLAPVLMGTVYVLAVALGRGVRGAPVAVFTLFSVMSLLDRQGFFYALVGLAALTVHATRGGRRDLALAAAAAVTAMVVYNLMVGPFLVQRINGYAPSFEYQGIPLRPLLLDEMIVPHSGMLMLKWTTMLVGGLAPWVYVVAAAPVVVWAWLRRMAPASLVRRGLALAQVALGTVMLARTPTLFTQYDYQLWYYGLPFQALLTALLVVAVGSAVPSWSARRARIVNALLAGVVMANVAGWDDHRRVQLEWPWFGDVTTQSEALKASLADGRPRPVLMPDYLSFFEFWRQRAPGLRARAQRAGDSAR